MTFSHDETITNINRNGPTGPHQAPGMIINHTIEMNK